ncbi:unnamed protein product [Spirodela intermedia]|uniref:Uncharacterized protein n=1 Tax=Spirodela intermedia TaxID=51605 RepID=A0A7I8JIV5_SPIIN|nr:unnamed protein product [Spirodela intermedia]CAA6670098.1 unnamed protein product [Spirodela intermedia]
MIRSAQKILPVLALVLALSLQSASGLRFVIDREECFSHQVPYEGDTVHVSFVVIKTEGWGYGDDGVDLVVQEGVHRFCFTNKSPYHETIDFDIHVNHFAYFEQHAKDGKNIILLPSLSKLANSRTPSNIQFEQHWLEAETERQAIFSGAYRVSVQVYLLRRLLQVYLLRRLFERKLGSSRV